MTTESEAPEVLHAWAIYLQASEEARSRGELRTNSFVRLRKVPVDRAPMLDVNDLGDAEMLCEFSASVDEVFGR